MHGNILQYITIYYNILQYITIYYTILQYINMNNACCFRRVRRMRAKKFGLGTSRRSLVPRLENWDVGSGTRLDVYFVALATRNQGGFY